MEVKTKAEFDALQALWQAEADARKQARDEHNAWVAESHARREAWARGEIAPTNPQTIPSLSTVFAANDTARQHAAAEAEIARIGALTPAQLKAEVADRTEQLRRSALPWAERQRIEKWELVNKRPWPTELETSHA